MFIEQDIQFHTCPALYWTLWVLERDRTTALPRPPLTHHSAPGRANDNCLLHFSQPQLLQGRTSCLPWQPHSPMCKRGIIRCVVLVL